MIHFTTSATHQEDRIIDTFKRLFAGKLLGSEANVRGGLTSDSIPLAKNSVSAGLPERLAVLRNGQPATPRTGSRARRTAFPFLADSGLFERQRPIELVRLQQPEHSGGTQRRDKNDSEPQDQSLIPLVLTFANRQHSFQLCDPLVACDRTMVPYFLFGKIYHSPTRSEDGIHGNHGDDFLKVAKTSDGDLTRVSETSVG